MHRRCHLLLLMLRLQRPQAFRSPSHRRPEWNGRSLCKTTDTSSGRSGFGGGGASAFKHLHARTDAHKLDFAAAPVPPEEEAEEGENSGEGVGPGDPLATASLQYTSTVALVPPEDAWPVLQATRRRLRDKGIYRWPPHINLLYPFLPPEHFQAAAQILAPALAAATDSIRKDRGASSSSSPFTITLDELAIFGGRNRGVLYCCPSDESDLAALRTLQDSLQTALPFCHHQQRKSGSGSGESGNAPDTASSNARGDDSNRGGGGEGSRGGGGGSGGAFTPHLTLAHFPSREEAEEAREGLLSGGVWKPVTFDIADAVSVMHRDGGAGQFRRCVALPLGGASPRIFGAPERRGAAAGGDGGSAAAAAERATTAWAGARRFEGMPPLEEDWVRDARREQKRARFGRGRRGGGGRRRRGPRRTPGERAAIAARTPEDIERIRAERKLKRERLAAAEEEQPSGGGVQTGDSRTTHGNPFSGRNGFAEIGVCICEHDNGADGNEETKGGT